MKLTVCGRNFPLVIEYNQPTLLSSLLREFNNCGAGLDMPCGGRGSCLKCRVTATGELSPLCEREHQMLTEEEKLGGVRFACLTTAVGDVMVTLPGAVDGQAILGDSGVVSAVAQWDGQDAVGVSVDIGTTTIAAALYDLKTGKMLASDAAHNPQSVFGADVISRITRSMAGDADALAQPVRSCILKLCVNLAALTGVEISEIDILCITGNTAMLYLLCGYDPSDISAAPFEARHLFGTQTTALALGLGGMRAKVYLTRCISAYVGGDITSAILACGLEQFDTGKNTFLVDVGTNGEMALSVGGRIVCCSTAAGPAFEGAGIAMGMQAADGAIDRVWRGDDGSIFCRVIGGGAARGICGSGIIDAIAVMLDAGIVDETGLIVEDDHDYTDSITEYREDTAFLLPGTDVVITSRDIRAIQLGKAAVCAGIYTLLAATELQTEQVDALLVAGGFGTYMDMRSAARIGLIPPALAGKARAVGNAAARGAAMTMLSRDVLEKAETVPQKCETVDLSVHPVFMEQYVEQMMFNN